MSAAWWFCKCGEAVYRPNKGTSSSRQRAWNKHKSKECSLDVPALCDIRDVE